MDGKPSNNQEAKSSQQAESNNQPKIIVIPFKDSLKFFVSTKEGLIKLLSLASIFASLMIIWTTRTQEPAAGALHFFSVTYWVWLMVDIVLSILKLNDRVPQFLRHVVFLVIVYGLCLLGITIASIILITSGIGLIMAASALAILSEITLIIWFIESARTFRTQVVIV